MERDLNEREKAGVPDAVLLEDYKNEDVFIENLEKRFNENIIYVSRNSRQWHHRSETFCLLSKFFLKMKFLSVDLHRSSVDLGESL